MRLTAFVSDKGYENVLYPLLIRGAAAHGDTITTKMLADYKGPEADAGILLGVVKREALWDHQKVGHPVLYLDKGFIRARAQFHDMSLPAWWRLCWQATHPTDYLMELPCRPERLWTQRREADFQPQRQGRRHILIAGSSAKYHLTHHLPHPTAWTTHVLRQIRQHSDLPVVYRPKPSWAGAEPVPGTLFDWGEKRPLHEALDGAAAVIASGSIAGVEAVLAGVPVICLANAPCRPVSATVLSALREPYWPSESERIRWAANLSWCHWRPEELENGVAWAAVKEQMKHVF